MSISAAASTTDQNRLPHQGVAHLGMRGAGPEEPCRGQLDQRIPDRDAGAAG